MIYKEIDYDRARSLIIKRLKRDKSYHEQGLCEKMGESYDDFDREFPLGCSDLMIAWTFWDAWMAERNQGFSNIYSGITKDSWPKLAEHVIEQLEKKMAITHPHILAHFDFLLSPFDSVQGSVLSAPRKAALPLRGFTPAFLTGGQESSVEGLSKTGIVNTQFPSSWRMNWIPRWKNVSLRFQKFFESLISRKNVKD